MQFLRRDFIVGILLYTLLFFGITAFFLSQFYQDPYVFFNQTGDGIKNNSTFLYHVLHDNSWWHHQEMNYPFGENILFTDCQPLLANTVKFLVNSFPFLKNHVQAIYNANLFFVWFLGGLALLQLFYKMGIHSALSAVLAISCILMNPQINRLLCGHHALSYPLLPFLFLWWYNILHLKKDTIFNLAKITLVDGGSGFYPSLLICLWSINLLRISYVFMFGNCRIFNQGFMVRLNIWVFKLFCPCVWFM
jgi:hypothetical protein